MPNVNSIVPEAEAGLASRNKVRSKNSFYIALVSASMIIKNEAFSDSYKNFIFIG